MTGTLPDPPCWSCGHAKDRHGEDEEAGPECIGIGARGDCPCEGYRPGAPRCRVDGTMIAMEGTDLCRFHSGHTVSPVPNTPGTPRRTIRVPDALWDAAQAKAQDRGDNLSEIIRKALERYVRRSR